MQPESKKPLLKRLNTHSALAVSGMTGPLVLVATDMVAAFTCTGYSLVQHSISRLALTPLGWVQTIGFLAIGLLVEIFVAGLLFNIRGVRGFHLSIAMLVFFGFGMLLIGAFHTDPSDYPNTIEGIIHWSTALAVFWLFPVAILIIAPSLKNDPNWSNLYVYTIVAGIVALGLVIALMFMRAQISWFGLYERILVANIVIWVEIAAIRLFRISLNRA